VDSAHVALPDGTVAPILIFASYYTDTAHADKARHDLPAGASSSSPSGYRTASPVYIFDRRTQAFQLTQTLATAGTVDLEVFEMEGFSWLAVANSFDGSYTKVPSTLYRWHVPQAAFVEHQHFSADGARQWRHFTCGAGRDFLALSQNSRSDGSNLTEIFHWRWDKFPAKRPDVGIFSPSNTSDLRADEIRLEGFSWVRVQSISTDTEAHVEGGLFGSVCQIIVSGSCDNCSKAFSLVESGPFVNEDWEDHFVYTQTLPVPEGASSLSLYRISAAAYLAITLPDLKSSNGGSEKGGDGAGGALLVLRFDEKTSMWVESSKIAGVSAEFKAQFTSVAGEQALLLPSVDETTLLRLTPAALQGSFSRIPTKRGIADFSLSSARDEGEGHPYGSFSSLAPRNASAYDTFVGWQVSAVDNAVGSTQSLPSALYLLDQCGQGQHCPGSP